MYIKLGEGHGRVVLAGAGWERVGVDLSKTQFECMKFSKDFKKYLGWAHRD